MTSADKQSSSEVAHEAEDARAELAHTLQQLRDNLKPEHVIEEVVGNARIGASTIADNIYSIARENPIPALLIGAGCALVFGLGARSGVGNRKVLNLKSLTRHDNDGQPGTLTSAASSKGDGWTPYRKTDAWPRDGLADANASFKAGRNIMSGSMGSFNRAASNPKATLTSLLHDQPLIIAALGVAVGAAIGAALPGTDVEDGWMGGTSSSMKQAAQDAARDQIDELKSVASRTADNLKASASDHGLSTDNLKEFVKDAGEHAKTAIHDVGSSDKTQPV